MKIIFNEIPMINKNPDELMTSKSNLIHYKIQAAMRENVFEEDQMKYLGVRDGKHWYLVAGEHEVSVDQIEDFEMNYDD